MLRFQLALLALVSSVPAVAENQLPLSAPTGDDQHPIYIEVVVTACPAVEKALEPHGQGDVPGDARAMSHSERISWYSRLGCVDVPIPPEWMTREMTYTACTQHGGWQAAIEFLQKRQDLRSTPEVGQIECIVSDHPFLSVASQ